MACVVDEELVIVVGDDVGRIAVVEPCPAGLFELDGDVAAELEGVVDGVIGFELDSVVVVGISLSVLDVGDSVEGANELLGSLPLHLET